jgi:hypothetical protein
LITQVCYSPLLSAYSSKDGSIPWAFDTNRIFQTVNGVPGNGGTMDASGAVMAEGMLYVNAGYNSIVGRAANVLLAFRLLAFREEQRGRALHRFTRQATTTVAQPKMAVSS